MLLSVLLACRPDPTLTAQIDQVAANRDLVAVTNEPADLEWSVDGTAVDFGERVPATEVRPGQVWTVVATTEEGTAQASHTIPDHPGGNVLVLLLDDIGIEKLDSYGGVQAPPTPTIDALAAQSLRFTRAYASPVCTPTRGVLMTGRHARRTGLGWIADTGARVASLPYDTTTIPEALPAEWSHSAVGKWHLAGPRALDWLHHPNDSGFDWFAGSPGNPDYAPNRGYWNWDRNENGVITNSTTYMTTDSIDTALERMQAMPEPWFLYLAVNAAHGPLSVPPDDLVPGPNVVLEDPRPDRFDAILQAFDTELARLLEAVDESDTTLMFIGDNGTAGNGIWLDFDNSRVKHTPYEGGIRVPFLLRSPHVQPGVSDSLVHVADVLPTIMEIAGVPLVGSEGYLLEGEIELDGRSLLRPTGREVVYAEAFAPNHVATPTDDRRALMSDTHKLVRWNNLEEFYVLEGPHKWDVNDLLLDGDPMQVLEGDELNAYLDLTARLDVIEATL